MFWSGGKERNHLELAGPAKWELLKSSRQQIKSLIFLFVERLGSLCVTGQSDGLVSYILNTDTRTIYLWNMEYTGGINWWNVQVEYDEAWGWWQDWPDLVWQEVSGPSPPLIMPGQANNYLPTQTNIFSLQVKLGTRMASCHIHQLMGLNKPDWIWQETRRVMKEINVSDDIRVNTRMTFLRSVTVATYTSWLVASDDNWTNILYL